METHLTPTTYLTDGGTFVAYHHHRATGLGDAASDTIEISLHISPRRSYSLYKGMVCVLAGTWYDEIGLQTAKQEATLRDRGVILAALEDLEAQTRAYLQAHPEHGTTPAKQVLYEAESTPPRGPHLNWKNRPSFGS